MNEVRTFIHTKLKLSIAEEKSGIRKSCETTRFLGYDIKCVTQSRIIKLPVSGRHTTKQSIVEQMQLHIPQEKLQKFCHSKGYGNYQSLVAIHRRGTSELSVAEIIKVYNAELRGIANYYALANLAKGQLTKLFYVGFYSLLKTLAFKQKTSIPEIRRRLSNGKGRYAHTVTNGLKTYTVQVFQLKDFIPGNVSYGNIDLLPNTTIYTSGSTELTKRMLAGMCEYCGKVNGYWEVHHVRALKDVQDGKEPWQKITDSTGFCVFDPCQQMRMKTSY